MSDELVSVLEESRRLGFLGPGAIEQHIHHAMAFVEALVGEPVDGLVVDLGSGGGVPGLVMATSLPRTSWCLLDSNQRRTAFLTDAVATLGLTGRVAVRMERAEVSGRDVTLRHGAAVVVARSFAAPPVTAECAAPLLQVGGRLLVSEPPSESADRWDEAGMKALGLVPEKKIVGPPRLVLARQEALCPEQFPRRTGIPGKRPAW